MRAPKYIKQILTYLKEEIDNNTIRVGDFNNPVSTMDRSSRQKIIKETLKLNYTLEQIDLTDIYRAFHSTVAEYKFFSNTYGAFSRVDNMLGYKRSLNKFKKIENIYAANIIVPKYMKLTLIELKGEIGSCKIITEDFNTPPSKMDIARQK